MEVGRGGRGTPVLSGGGRGEGGRGEGGKGEEGYPCSVWGGGGASLLPSRPYELINKLKTLPSRRTTYAGGKYG